MTSGLPRHEMICLSSRISRSEGREKSISIPKAYYSFNMQGALSQRHSVGDLPSLTCHPRSAYSFPSGSADSSKELRPEPCPHKADGQPCCNLLLTPLHVHQRTGFFVHPRLNGWGIATVLHTLCPELTG